MEKNIRDPRSQSNYGAFPTGEQAVQVHPHFEVSSIVSVDASGILYRGKSCVDDRSVAIKLFTGQVASSRESIKDHPLSTNHLVKVNDIFTATDGTPFAVMDVPRGACLERILSKQAALQVATAINIALNVSIIVRPFHKRGDAHGHLNPQSIFLKRQNKGQIQLQLLHYALVGRPSQFNDQKYLSPELLSEKSVAHPCDDRWAIGALLCQMLLGAPPFVGATGDELIGRILAEELSLPIEFKTEFPRVAAFLEKALAKDSEERFENSDEMVRQLKLLRDETRSLKPTRAVCLRKKPDDDNSVNLQSQPPCVSESFVADENIVAVVPTEVLPAQQVSHVEESLRITVETIVVNPELSRRTTMPSPPSETNIVVSYVDELDSTKRSFYSEQIAKEEQQYNHHFRGKYVVIWILAAALLFGAIGIFVYRAFVGETTPSAPSIFPDEAVHLSESLPVPVNHPQQTPSREASEKSINAFNGDSSDAGKRIAEFETIAIELENLPKSAHITLNGRRAEAPFVVAKSETPLVLNAFVNDRLFFTTTISPTENKTVVVNTERLKKKVKKYKRSGVARNSESSEKSLDVSSNPQSGNLSSNPHNLRKNPFATGE